MTDTKPSDMCSIRFHDYGEPEDVLVLERVTIPEPGQNRILVRVHACGLNPADWALCRGLFPGKMPRGIGLDVAGFVDSVGEGVTNVRIGDAVLGSADFAGYASAGASDFAVLNHWAPVPEGLDMIHAASLTLVVETAFRSLESLRVEKGHTVLVHGGGTMVGFAAVQIALIRGAKVITTAGETFGERLRGFGAKVTRYGEGMIQRVHDIAQGSPDLILDTAPANGGLPDLLEIAGGDPRRILTISDFSAANEMGIRHSFSENTPQRYDVIGEFAKLAAVGKFSIPLALALPLASWKEAMDLSLSGHAHGKIVLQP